MNVYAQPHLYTQASFRALTDALLPSTSQSAAYLPNMAVHDYIIYQLDHSISIQQPFNHPVIPLAYPTAKMLDIAAAQLVNRSSTYPQFSGPGVFSSISRRDRIRTLSALLNLEIDLNVLPAPFQNNAGLVKNVADALNRFSNLGFYSEWPAYGTTRLLPPTKRRLEFFPLNWRQIGYPGVSFGYREFRGFLLRMNRNEGNYDDES